MRAGKGSLCRAMLFFLFLAALSAASAGTECSASGRRPVPAESAVPEETAVPEGSAVPEKRAVPEGSAVPEETAVPEGGPAEIDWQESVKLDDVEKVFEELQENNRQEQDLSPQKEEDSFSIRRYVLDVLSGKNDFSFRDIWDRGVAHICSQFEEHGQVLLRILLLGILSGIFLNFADSIGDRNLSETGFYVTFLVFLVTASAGFFAVMEVAEQAVESLLSFMKALVPSFSLALCFGGGVGTSAVYYQGMLIAISFLEMAMSYLFLPGVQVYFMIRMVDELADNHFSKLADLVRRFLRFAIRFLFGVLIGYQGIQGMLVPVMDRVKGNVVLKTAKGLPGVGNSIESVADTVMGSGMLVKSAIGVGGIVCIIVLCFYPIVKIFVFQLIYRICGAAVQPVSDKRVVSAVQTVAECGTFLLKFVFAGALMFLLSITIVAVSTNLTL